jgi:hypothetical protein
MPSSRQAASASSSTSRDHSEYSLCKAAIRCTREIDVIDARTLQACVTGRDDVLGTPVDAETAAFRESDVAEPDREHDLAAAGLQNSARSSSLRPTPYMYGVSEYRRPRARGAHERVIASSSFQRSHGDVARAIPIRSTEITEYNRGVNAPDNEIPTGTRGSRRPKQPQENA